MPSPRNVTPAALLLAALAACGPATVGDAGRGEDPFSITPPAVQLAPSAGFRFSASAVSVAWSVLEAGGGSIDATGRYTAPDTLGTYHVVATVPGAPGSATATVNVRAPSSGTVRELYATTAGGRTWYLPDDADLNADPEFVPETRDITIVQAGPSTVYRTAGSGASNQVRLNVHSPAGAAWWRNVEMTGYFRWLTTSGGSHPHWELFGRGERHSSYAVTKGRVNDGVPPPPGTAVWPWWSAFADGDTLNQRALGTSYHGNLYVTHGSDPAWALFEKEISHTAGYANQRGRVTTPNQIPGANQWFGAKFVIRNDVAATRVTLELWLDRAADGTWVKISEYTDENGVGNDWPGGGLDGTDAAPYNMKLNHLLTWAGPWVCFRSDNVTMEFRDLSVREIDPLP